MRRQILSLTGYFLMVVSTCSQSQIYKWTDEEGNVHFGDQHSKSGEAQEISKDLQNLNLSEGSDSGYVPSGESAYERKQRLKEEKAVKLASREPACKEARKQLKIISGRVYFTNEDGSEYTVSEAERVKMEEELRAEIKHYCS